MSNLTDHTAYRTRHSDTLPATCNPGDLYVDDSGGATGLYVCVVANTWIGPFVTTSGITNSAGVNALPKSDGTNLIASQISDDGSTISIVAATSIINTTPLWGTGSDGTKFQIDGNTHDGLITKYGGGVPSDGLLLIGRTSGGFFTTGTLTPGTGISVTNGAGSITIATTGVGLTANPLSQFASTTSAQLRGVLSDELGTGAALFDGATPTGLVLTNATGLPVSTGISGLASGMATFLATATSANLAAAISNETGSGALVFATSPALVTPDLGTPSAATLTNATGLPVSTGISGLAAGIATFLATPTSANLITAVTNETGSGALVFGTSPTLVTPTLGVATATSINGNTFTTGTYTLTGTAAKTLNFTNTLTLSGTDSTTMTFPSTSATIARTDAANTFAGDQIFSGTTAIGTTPATVGNVRLPNNTSVSFRNAANSANVTALNVDSSNKVNLGTSSDTVIVGGLWTVNPGTGSWGAAGSYPIIWTSGSPDTGIVKSSAGLVEINNGTAGTLRDLQLRNFTMATAGTLTISSGTNTRAGSLTLIGGTKTISNTTVTANTIVMLTRKTSGGTIGTAITYTLSAATSFTVNSDNVLDTSTFSYVLIENP